MRAAGLVLKELYGTDLTVSVSQLKEMFRRVREEEPAAVAAVKNNVKKSRQPLFLPGVHMILEIADIYQAETIFISKTNIREGFLLHCLKDTPYNLY
jgi:exopolyphosphatase/guanosine-5'-triphosphate,3'-diphosphate pyrophosphatase